MSKVQKKLQAFISSTFTDLRDERQAAVEATLLAKHIPAGMELFSAGDASQWQVIQEWISESDVYLLILGARYGSIEPTSGFSYTELEYDFAVKRGMPYFAVVLDEAAVTAKRDAGFVSSEDGLQAEKLAAFRSKVLSRSSKMVKDSSGIQLAILQSLHEIERRSTLVGWVRSNEAVDTGPLIEQLRELSQLKKENDALKIRTKELEAAANGPDFSALHASVNLIVRFRDKGFSTWHSKPVTITWGELFASMAIKLLAPTNDGYLNRAVAGTLLGKSSDDTSTEYQMNEQDWELVKAKFLQLQLVIIEYSATVAKTMALFWSLTPLGKEVGIILKTKSK